MTALAAATLHRLEALHSSMKHTGHVELMRQWWECQRQPRLVN